jgi:hypothetical protein
MGFSVSFGWGKEKVELSDLFSELNDWASEKGETMHIVIDKAQELMKLRGYSILPSIAYAYDNLKNRLHLHKARERRRKGYFRDEEIRKEVALQGILQLRKGRGQRQEEVSEGNRNLQERMQLEGR